MLALDIQSSKHSTLLSIARQINSHLEKSVYAQVESEKSIYDLKSELHEIHQDYPFTPSSLASEVIVIFRSDYSWLSRQREISGLKIPSVDGDV